MMIFQFSDKWKRILILSFLSRMVLNPSRVHFYAYQDAAKNTFFMELFFSNDSESSHMGFILPKNRPYFHDSLLCFGMGKNIKTDF